LVIVDHNKNIQRIVDRILNDSNLYDKGKTEGKLRDVFFGDPENNDKMAVSQMPYLYVTTRTGLQTSRRDVGISLAENSRQVVVEYELTIVAKSNAKSVESQKQIYDIIKNLTALSETYPTFTNPADNLDPIFTRSVISAVPYDESTRGQLITSISVVLLATIGSTYTINFPGIGDVVFLSRPSNPDGITFDENWEGQDRVVTPSRFFGNFFGEYESTFALDTAFRAKYGVEENVTFKRGSDQRVFKIVYVEINPTASYDTFDRTILHLEIVQ